MRPDEWRSQFLPTPSHGIGDTNIVRGPSELWRRYTLTERTITKVNVQYFDIYFLQKDRKLHPLFTGVVPVCRNWAGRHIFERRGENFLSVRNNWHIYAKCDKKSDHG